MKCDYTKTCCRRVRHRIGGYRYCHYHWQFTRLAKQ
jgi:hypothetical protein